MGGGRRARCGGSTGAVFPDAKDDLRPLCHKRLRPWLDFHALLIKKRRWHDHPLARDILIKDILHEYRRIFAD